MIHCSICKVEIECGACCCSYFIRFFDLLQHRFCKNPPGKKKAKKVEAFDAKSF